MAGVLFRGTATLTLPTPWWGAIAPRTKTPLYAPTLAGRQIELDQMAEVLKLSVDDFAAHARNLVSPDELSVYIAKQLMRQLSPAFYGSPCTTSTSPTPGLSRSTSTASNAPTACRAELWGPYKRIPSTRTRRRCSSCRISAATPTSTLISTYLLTVDDGGNRTGGKIVETEAYDQDDLAAHCHQDADKRRREGSKSMLLQGGHAYIYPYRLSVSVEKQMWCLNFTCDRK